MYSGARPPGTTSASAPTHRMAWSLPTGIVWTHRKCVRPTVNRKPPWSVDENPEGVRVRARRVARGRSRALRVGFVCGGAEARPHLHDAHGKLSHSLSGE